MYIMACVYLIQTISIKVKTHIMTSSNGDISALLALCAGNWHRPPVNSPHQGQWREALVFSLICAPYKRLSKQSRRRWFETPSRSLWRHCNEGENPGEQKLSPCLTVRRPVLLNGKSLKKKSSIWHYRPWWHHTLSLRQLTVPPMTTK